MAGGRMKQENNENKEEVSTNQAQALVISHELRENGAVLTILVEKDMSSIPRNFTMVW